MLPNKALQLTRRRSGACGGCGSAGGRSVADAAAARRSSIGLHGRRAAERRAVGRRGEAEGERRGSASGSVGGTMVPAFARNVL